MINRVLIRIKVVQLLYSYFLTRSEFKIENMPDTSSRDKRYAHTIYLDVLLYILQLAGYKVRNEGEPASFGPLAADKYLTGNRMASALASDDTLRGVILRGNSHIEDFDDTVEGIYNDILASGAYRSYTKLPKRELKEDVDFWVAIIRTMLAKDQRFVEAARRNEAFTVAGFELGIERAIDTLSNFSDNHRLLSDARIMLDSSLAKAYELYHSLLWLSVEITRMQERRLEAGRHKYLPTDSDLNPNMRLVDNAMVKALAESPEMVEYMEKNAQASWADDDRLVRSFLDKILASDLYAEYIAQPEATFAGDCEFWRAVYRHIILPSDELEEALENKSIYWNDDLAIMSTFVLKTIKQIANTNGEKPVKILPMYKDEEDERFGPTLFKLSVDHREEYRSYIDRFIRTDQWDTERLAFMDIVIMITAIAELLNFPQIPLPVTLNEYIEIANCYSTPRSGHFINGILYSVINYLRNEGKLHKE